MSIVQSDYVIGNTRLDLQSGDGVSPIVLGSASGFNVGQLAVSNATSVTGATTLTLASTSGDVTLNAANAVSMSGKAVYNTTQVELNSTTDPSKPYALWANAAGVNFSQGATGSVRLARSLREAYGTTASDANIAVTTTRPVVLYDASNAGTQLLGVQSAAGSDLFSVSNVAVAVNRNLNVTGRSTLTGDVSIAGNMSVTGNITTINSEQVNLQDSTLYLNAGYTTTSGKTGGFAVNYLPTSNTSTITATFTPGVVSTSNPIITGLSVALAWAVDGVVVQVSGSSSNDGIYEILSSNVTAIVIRGVGTSGVSAPLLDIVANQFVSEAGTAGVKVTQVNTAVLRVNSTNGSFQVAKGNTSAGMTYKNLGDVSFTGTAPTGGNISTYADASGVNIQATPITITGANIAGIANISAGNLAVTGQLSGALANISGAANSVVVSTSSTLGPLFNTVLQNAQTTNATPLSMATVPVGVANATVTMRSYIVCKEQGSATNYMGINMDAAFRADNTGALTLIAAPSRAIFRNGFLATVTATVVAVGTGFAIQVTGNANTVNWQASTEYTVGRNFI